MNPPRDKLARACRELVRRRTPRLALQLHPHLVYLRRAQASLATVALSAARHGVLPAELAAEASRFDVIEAEVGRAEEVVAVLAAVAVAKEDVSSCECRLLYCTCRMGRIPSEHTNFLFAVEANRTAT